MATSTEFISGSEFNAAYEQIKKASGKIRLESRAGGQGPWMTVSGVTSTAAARRYVRALDRSPRPGRFRLVRGED